MSGLGTATPVPAGFVDVRGVPAVASASEGGSALLAAWLVPLWLLCVVFWAMTAWEARELLSRYEGDRHWLKVGVVQHSMPESMMRPVALIAQLGTKADGRFDQLLLVVREGRHCCAITPPRRCWRPRLTGTSVPSSPWPCRRRCYC